MKIRVRMMRRRHVRGVLMSRKPTVAVALAFAVSILLLESDCGNSPAAPAPATKSSNYHGTFTSTNYPPTSLDMALSTTGGGATQPVTGSYSTGKRHHRSGAGHTYRIARQRRQLQWHAHLQHVSARRHQLQR
jgi:hypothetical protein